MLRRGLVFSILVLSISVPALAACGGKGATTADTKKVDLDADPFALLPASPVLVANIDARAILDSDSAGAQVAALVARVAPLGADAGFDASRDVDRIALASYATGGVDFVAVMSGRFDEEKIAHVTATPQGGAIVRGSYAERTTYTAGNLQYAVLTPRTLVAGSGDSVRRLLDRIRGGTLDRSVPPWMVQTLETRGAPMAAAADFETQPAFAAALGSVNLDWVKGLRIARVIGNFAPPGVNIAATLTYGEPEQAQAAAGGLRLVDSWLKMLGPLLGGVRLQNFEVATDSRDLRCKFALDDKTLRAVLALAPRLLPMPP
jgi:hypothetical protein